MDVMPLIFSPFFGAIVLAWVGLILFALFLNWDVDGGPKRRTLFLLTGFLVWVLHEISPGTTEAVLDGFFRILP